MKQVKMSLAELVRVNTKGQHVALDREAYAAWRRKLSKARVITGADAAISRQRIEAGFASPQRWVTVTPCGPYWAKRVEYANGRAEYTYWAR